MVTMLSKPSVWIVAEADFNHWDAEWSIKRLTCHPPLELVDKVSDPFPMEAVRVIAAFLYV